MAAQPKPKGKLSKSEIIEILESNAQIYKDEPNFVKYLVELAIYLIQHQYDPDIETRADTEAHDEIPSEFQQSGHIYALHSGFRVRRKTATCRFCGGETKGEKRCPTCGLLTS